jgi:glutathione synthase/RimK-type ligase-like ATP-grasp enzyme
MLREICEECKLAHTSESMGWIQVLKAPANRDRAREFLVQLGSSTFVSHYLEALYKSNPRAEIRFTSLFVYGSSLPLNGQSSSKTCSDKAAAAIALSRAHIPAVPHHLATSPISQYSGFKASARAARGTFPWLMDLLRENSPHGLVLKPKSGSQGSDTFRVRNQLELEQAWIKLLSNQSRDFVACPFLHLVSEWRCVFLDGTMRLCFQKTPAQVVGNGKQTLAELVRDYERDVIKGGKVRIGDWAAGGSGGSKVRRTNTSLSRVVGDGELVQLDWCHNLSRGARADKNVPEAVLARLESLGLRTMRALSLRFASVDICAVANNLSGDGGGSGGDDGGGNGGGNDSSSNIDMLVLEVNSNVNTNGYLTQNPEDWNLVRDIYKDAVLCHFRTQAARVIADAL